MAERHYVAVYFDNAEQKRAFRMVAAQLGMSMAEAAKRAVCEQYDLPLFLEQVSDAQDERPEHEMQPA